MAPWALIAAAAVLLVLLQQAAAFPFLNLPFSFGKQYSGDATYYGYRTRGFGHCSFHFHGFGTSPGYAGTPLAINAAQYTGTSSCGLCVMYRGKGGGSGGNPVVDDWQPGFVCDECPECKFGDIDQQKGGDGRWDVEWKPVQCPVGSSAFKYGFQGGNPWYKKIQVANGRVPIGNVKLNGAQLTKTIDNYWEYHGGEDGWNRGGCAKMEITSILGDTVTDMLCCKTGTCNGRAQFPCRSDMDGCDGGGAKKGFSIGFGPFSINFDAARKASAKAAANYRKGGVKRLGKSSQCGGNGGHCAKFGGGQCKDRMFNGYACKNGLKCVRSSASWWGCY